MAVTTPCIISHPYRRLIVQQVHAELASVENRVVQLGSVDRSTVRSQLAAEFRVVVRACLVEARDVSVAPPSLAVCLGVVRVEVVAAGECPVAPRDPAYVRLLLGVALHVPLQVLLSLEAAWAAGLLALELDLLDDGWQVVEGEVRLGRVSPGELAGWVALALGEVTVDG